MGGERGNIGQTKISSKREKEREQLMEPEETVTALKRREGTVGILYEERREGEKAWSSRGVWRKEKRRGESLESGEDRHGASLGRGQP